MPTALQRLKNRKLVEWMVAYLAGAWLVMQLVEVLADRWPLPLTLQRGIDVVLVVGFFVALTLAWYHGEQGRQRVTGLELLILSGLFVTGGALLGLVDRTSPPAVPQTAEARPDPKRFLDADAPGIAVLPFRNLSADPEQEYFVAGMHEALIGTLSRIQDFRVISRTSSMRYAHTDRPIPEIATELDVDAVIEGSVHQVGDRVRISVQLIDGFTDEHLWADEYDRDLRDVLVLLSQVAELVAEQAEVALAPHDAALLRSAQRVDPELHDLYMRGRFFYGQLSADGLDRSVEYFERAIQVDSAFAPAWAGLAGAHVLRAYLGVVPPVEGMSNAERAALRAVALDDGSSVAHTALGWVRLLHQFDWDDARREFEVALDIDANDVDALHGFGDYLTITGSPEDGLAYVRRASENDPFSPMWGHAVVGHLHFMGRFEEAIAEARRVVELYPQSPVWQFKGGAQWELGRVEEALESFRTAFTRRPRILEALESGLSDGGPRAAVRGIAEAAAVASEQSGAGASGVALWYARAGDPDRALDWLERAYDQRGPDLAYVGVRPEFAALYDHPRFVALLERIRVTPLPR